MTSHFSAAHHFNQLLLIYTKEEQRRQTHIPLTSDTDIHAHLHAMCILDTGTADHSNIPHLFWNPLSCSVFTSLSI